MKNENLRRRAALVAWQVLLERASRNDVPLDLKMSEATGRNAWIMADMFMVSQWEPKKT